MTAPLNVVDLTLVDGRYPAPGTQAAVGDAILLGNRRNVTFWGICNPGAQGVWQATWDPPDAIRNGTANWTADGRGAVNVAAGSGQDVRQFAGPPNAVQFVPSNGLTTGAAVAVAIEMRGYT